MEMTKKSVVLKSAAEEERRGGRELVICLAVLQSHWQMAGAILTNQEMTRNHWMHIYILFS